MGRILGVSFSPRGRLFLLDAVDVDARPGDHVLLPTGHGPAVAQCVCVTEGETRGLPACAGLATEADLERDRAHRVRRAEIRGVAAALIAEHGLPMTIVGVDHVDRTPSSERVAIIYYRAPHRVDFRALLGSLSRALRARIELCQIGDRDEAALVGGVAMCGRELCCALMGPAKRPVRGSRGVEAAGVCGHVQCCVAYR